MAGNNVRIGALRYDIIADSSLFSRGVDKAAKMSRKLAKDVALTRTPLERYKKEIMQANRAQKAGLIDQKAYLHAKKRLKRQYYEENALINKHTHKLLLNTKAKNANAAASSRMNLANIGGAAASMFGGRGGAAVGRGIGIGAMAGGPAGMALAAGFGGAYAIARMVEEFGDLQEAATDLKVFLGEEFGEESANAFRKIARESSLTTKGLIKNARVWASYGLATENIVDIVERLGIAAGGEAEAFDNLTRAFAQVNAAGKLMGQEKNQLINAGFSLKIIADEAGISMTNFAKSMEAGAISAKHVNDALIKATSEGGLYFGRLEKKSATLNGQLDLVANNFNDLFANLGESKSGFFSTILSQLNETLSETSKTVSEANELERERQKTARLQLLLDSGGTPETTSSGRGVSSTFAPGSIGVNQFIRGYGAVMDAYADKTIEPMFRPIAAMIGLWTELTTSDEEAYLQQQQDLQQERAKQRQIEKDLEEANIKIPGSKGTGGDPNKTSGAGDGGLSEAAKQAAGLPGNLGPGTIDEYNFIRDKMMEDRELAFKSFQELKQQTVQLKKISGEGARPKPGVWSPRYSRRNSKHQQAMRARAGMLPESTRPELLPITGFEPQGIPNPQFGMSAVDQVNAEYKAKRRGIYDKWKSMPSDSEFNSQDYLDTQKEREGYEKEAGDLRRQHNKDLEEAREQDETQAKWAEFLSTRFETAIEKQTKALAGGEDKQLQGVD